MVVGIIIIDGNDTLVFFYVEIEGRNESRRTWIRMMESVSLWKFAWFQAQRMYPSHHHFV